MNTTTRSATRRSPVIFALPQALARLRITQGNAGRRMLGATAMGLASLLPQQADSAIIYQLSTSEVGNDKTAPIAIENNDSGVSYSSLKLDSGIANLLWQAYGVADLYNNDFSSFLNSGLFGYNISSGSQVQGGWNSSVNPDGTISLTNVGGPSDQFSTGKTMTGNYFFNKSLLDTDGDGNANYTFHLLSDAQGMDNFTSPLTKTGIVGSNLGGNFAEALTADSFPYSASGQAYALVFSLLNPRIYFRVFSERREFSSTRKARHSRYIL